MVAGLTSVITMVWFYADHDFLRRRLAGFGAIFHPNDVGRLYGIAALSTYFGLVMGGTWGRSKALFIVILALLVAFVVLTGSRGSILALGAAVFAGAVAMRHWALVAAFSLLVVGAVAAAMLGGMGDLNAISRGSSYRSEIWAVVLDRIAERPWFGHGIEADETVPYSRGRAIHAHQMYLSNQFYGGVVATALLALMLAAAGRAAYRDFRSTGSFVLAALLIFVIVGGLVDFGRLLHTVNWVWLVFWLPIALIAGREVCDKAAGQASPQV